MGWRPTERMDTIRRYVNRKVKTGDRLTFHPRDCVHD
jgi:hypothetical protein